MDEPLTITKANTITFKKVFGNGIDLVFENNANQLKEKLIIKNPSSLPGLDGLTGDVYLAFTGWMNYSDDLELYINGNKFDSGMERTDGNIEFRINGTTVFYFDRPLAYNSNDRVINVEYMLHDEVLHKDHGSLHDENNKLFWTVLIPYQWLNESHDQYPITVDPTISYDLSMSGMDAWDYAGISAPEPGNASWAPASPANKMGISDLDSLVWETKKTTGHDQYDFQLYRFKLNKNVPVLEISTNWTGYGEDTAGYNTSLYIWNFTSGSYELLDSALLAVEGMLKGNVPDPGYHVNGNNEFYLLSGARHYNYAPPNPVGLSASPGAIDVTISWSPVIEPDGDSVEYFVQIDGKGNSGWFTGTSWYYAGLSQQKTYYYRVKSRDTFANAESGWSVGTFRTLPGYGSCPFVYIWNGYGYEYLTDIAGGVINIPKKSVSFYNYSYIDMRGLDPAGDTYKLKLREVIDEIDYVDHTSLLLVDHPRNVEIVSSGAEKRLWEEVPFEIFTLNKPRIPISATYMDGTDITETLVNADGNTAPADFYNDDYITLDFGRVSDDTNAKLVIDGWTFFNEKMRKDMVIEENIWPYIEVVDDNGNWAKARDFGYITGDYKTLVINLSGAFISNDHRIRIHTGLFRGHSEIIMDRIRLDTSAPVPVTINEVPADYANLHYRGGATLDYSNLSSRIHALDDEVMDEPAPYYGNYTKYGDVLPLLASVDDKYVIMRHGDELELEFVYNDSVPGGKVRTPILKTYLWFKVLHPRYPDPLPFINMTRYPYNTSFENYPADTEHLAYLKNWNTRSYLPQNDSNTSGSLLEEPRAGTVTTARSLNTDFIIVDVTTGGGNTSWMDQDSSSGTVRQGSPLVLSARAKDDYCLESAVLATNESGTWRNITGLYGSPLVIGCNNNWTWTNFTWQNVSIEPGTTVGWKIYYTNNLGYSNVTGIMTFTVEEAALPVWRYQGSNSDSVIKGGSITLYAQGLDESCLKGATLMTNESGVWENRTAVTLDCGGNNWTWTNFTWSNSGVPSGTTVGWKICYENIANKQNCTDVLTFNTKNIYTWTRPSEYMVNPAGWNGIASPLDYRTVNITSAPVNTSGFIKGMSPLTASIYGPDGSYVGSVNLTGNGTYNGTFMLNDSIVNGVYSINISGHPELDGVFYLSRWSCSNCHADTERLPSTFNATILHNSHTDTRHSAPTTSCAGQNGAPCHRLNHASKSINCDLCHRLGEYAHVQDQSCNNYCHKQEGNTCSECHKDVDDNTVLQDKSLLLDQYGGDIHQPNLTCSDCHGDLPQPEPVPRCSGCHPRPDSSLNGLPVPDSMDNLTHSPARKVPCGSCHNTEHSLKDINYRIGDCKQCHREIEHNMNQECSNCHGPDPHNVTFGGGPDCIYCHDTANSKTVHLIDVNTFNSSVHFGMNSESAITEGYSETNGACWACHDSNGSNIAGMGNRFNDPYTCVDCHLEGGIRSGSYNAPIVYNHFRNGSAIQALSNASGDLQSCIECHENVSAMVIPNNDSETGSFAGDGIGMTGGNGSFYHYGMDRSDMGGNDYNYCTYCHNSSSEFDRVFMAEENTAILNHSLQNIYGMPSCENMFCHNSTGRRIHDPDLSAPELTTFMTGAPDSRVCLVCHDEYYQQEAPVPGPKVKHFGLNCSECHLYLPRDIHGVKYLQEDGKYNFSKSTAVDCVDCHVNGIDIQANLSLPIPPVMHPESLKD